MRPSVGWGRRQPPVNLQPAIVQTWVRTVNVPVGATGTLIFSPDVNLPEVDAIQIVAGTWLDNATTPNIVNTLWQTSLHLGVSANQPGQTLAQPTLAQVSLLSLPAPVHISPIPPPGTTSELIPVRTNRFILTISPISAVNPLAVGSLTVMGVTYRPP